MKIELHSRPGCPYCDMAKAWLDDRGIAYEHTSHPDHDEKNAFYDSLGLEGGKRTMPQIIVEQSGVRERVGGYSDLIASDVEQRWAVTKNGSFETEF